MKTIIVILKSWERLRFTAENWDGDDKWHWVTSGGNLIANFMNDSIVGIYEESFEDSGATPKDVAEWADALWEKIEKGEFEP